ncbi:MAG TPA: hypothetical protein PK156_19260 [Polyangium sp.]|nr:hypothetical protein [Polyangium sp.]
MDAGRFAGGSASATNGQTRARFRNVKRPPSRRVVMFESYEDDGVVDILSGMALERATLVLKELFRLVAEVAERRPTQAELDKGDAGRSRGSGGMFVVVGMLKRSEEAKTGEGASHDQALYARTCHLANHADVNPAYVDGHHDAEKTSFQARHSIGK